jgi:hypothetical protein
METRIQTTVADQNKIAFYQQVYFHQKNSKSQLVNLDHLSESTAILIDCCGWHYKNLFLEKNIVALECFKTIKQFKLDKTYFDKMIDNQSDNLPTWPGMTVDNCAVIFDRSPILKYCSLEKIAKMLGDVCIKYQPTTVILNHSLMFVDGPRLLDRFYEIAKLSISEYFVKTFEYNTDSGYLYAKFQKKIAL